MSELTTSNHINLAAEIVSAFVSNNAVPSAELPSLIASIHSALAKVANGPTEKPAEAPVPPVSIKKSITSDILISLEDGRRYKSLKRHLTGRGLIPPRLGLDLLTGRAPASPCMRGEGDGNGSARRRGGITPAI